jgi:hypothetical protein
MIRLKKMNSSTIDNLRKEAEKHRIIAEKIANFLVELQAFENGEGLPVSPHQQTAPKARAMQNDSDIARSGRFSAMTQFQAVEAVLKEKGSASAREILEELRHGGKPLPKTMYVSTVLSRYKHKFRSLGDGRWTLIQPEFPP